MPTNPQLRVSQAASVLFVAACLLALVPALARASTQVVVQTGDDSPDGNGELDLFNAPTINAVGQLAFLSQLSGTAGSSAVNTGLFRYDTNGNLARIARSGQTLESKTILGFFPSFGYISANGTVGSLAIFSGGGSAYTLGTGGALTQMYPTAMPSPSGQNPTRCWGSSRRSLTIAV
jgi:hypothetical protein